MSVVISSYTIYSTYIAMRTGSAIAVSQSFQAPAVSYVLNSTAFYLRKTGSPTGTAYAKIYAHSGTFGTSSVPTGSALSTATTTLNVAGLTTSFALTTFTWSTPYTLTPGNYYCITFEFNGGSSGNTVDAGVSNSAPAHPGNEASYISSWSATGYDLYHVAYGTRQTSIKTVNGIAFESISTVTGIAADSTKTVLGVS